MKTTGYPSGRSVCFARSFRCESADNISHFVPDGSEKTLCGRTGWAVDDGPASIFPDCLRCAAALEKLRAKGESERRPYEAVPGAGKAIRASLHATGVKVPS